MNTEKELAKAGRRLGQILKDRRKAAEALAEVVRTAHAEGMTEVRIAEVAGVDRMTVRRYLGKLPARRA